MNSNNFIAGLGGAIVLTILNESLKSINKDMPRIDLVGEEAVLKAANFFGVNMEEGETLYGTTLAGDILSNTAYYSLIDGEGDSLWRNAATSGVLAGIGAVMLPSKMGLDDNPVAKSMATKAWTVGYYTAGAFATAAVFKLLQRVRSNI